MNKKVILGIIFIASIALLYWGINFLKGLDVFSKHRVFYSEYNDVSGLLVASPVMVSGYKVGQVSEISFKKDQPGRLLVRFIITEKLDIPANSVARIESLDLLGTKTIVLQLGDSPTFASSGDYLKGEMETSLKEEVSIQMLPLKAKVESLLSSFDSALAVVQYIFNEDTRDNLNKSFESIRYTIGSLERAASTVDTILQLQKNKLGNIVSNVEAITLNIKNSNQDISNIITNFSKLSDTLLLSKVYSTFDYASRTMEELSEITNKINTGQGSLGLLFESDSIYLKLTKASEDLQLLLEDMRINPNRYIHFSVFGKNQRKQPYKPPQEK
jgi:phospholipid/cholesterol/gamma-HCH transport system substrate-binding protein